MAADNLLSPIDIALRSASGVLLLLLAGLLVRDHGRTWAARLGALFAVGVVAFAYGSMAGFKPDGSVPRAALSAISAGNNVIFWLFARALFSDDVRPRAWQAALWAAIVAATVMCGLVLRPLHSALAGPLDSALGVAALAFAILAVLQTLSSWPADLVDRRRRLRVWVVGATSGFIMLNALAGLLGVRDRAPEAVSLAVALGLTVIVVGVAWSFLGVAGGQALFVANGPQPASVAPPDLDLSDRQRLAALDRAMSVDRIYRTDGLSIGGLAAMHAIPEHRLRRLINQGLGHRNFNAFLNSYRIADARTGLADPSQAEVPILTIALDAGFSSLGPFNRAFKLETGMTPTEYRKDALARLAEAGSIPNSTGRFQKSA